MDNSFFCSGDFVIVLATEQDFAFRINDLHVVPVVPVFLGGMVGQCVFWGSLDGLASAPTKSLGLPIPYFSSRTEHIIYTIYSK